MLSGLVGRDDVDVRPHRVGPPGRGARRRAASSACSSTPCPPGSTRRPGRARRSTLLRRTQADRTDVLAHEHLGLGRHPARRRARPAVRHALRAAELRRPGRRCGDDLDGLPRRRTTSRGSAPPTPPTTPSRSSSGPGPRLRVLLAYRPDLRRRRPGRRRPRPLRPGARADRRRRRHAPVGALDLVGPGERAALDAEWAAADHAAARRSRSPSCWRSRPPAPPTTPRWSCGDDVADLRRARRPGQPVRPAAAGATAPGPSGWWRWRCPARLDMVAALFAVLRTGAAYLPLDLDLPADRRGVHGRRRRARCAC